jgi:hypothetical protein
VGTPRIYKGFALLQGCDAAGVVEKRLHKRVDPTFYRTIEKGRAVTLQSWQQSGNGDIEAVQALP